MQLIPAIRLLGTTFKKFFSMQSGTQHTDRYVWIDLELTGLDVEKDTILEISCIVTTPQLESVHEATSIVIHQSDEILNSMNDWCKKQHKISGLIEACKNSTTSLTEAGKQISKYILEHTPVTGTRYLAGNTVYMDRIFLMKHLPEVHDLFHYRIIDISSIKTLCSHWYPDVYPTLCKNKSDHRALSDIKGSIDELKKYRESIFK